jgi:hypothetical protein
VHGLPADFDPKVFVGRELQQISFTVNTIHLTFDGEVAITLEGSFLLRAGPAAETTKHTVPVTDSSLMSLVGKRILEARREGSTLALEYEGGGLLACLDDSREYESYHLRIGDEEIAV